MKKTRTELNGIYTTQATIKKWGNSQGIRISKEIMQLMDLYENDNIKINICDRKMIIEKIHSKKYIDLKERLEDFYKKPIDEINVESTQEIDIGESSAIEL